MPQPTSGGSHLTIRAGLAGLVALGYGLRMWGVDWGPLHPDEHLVELSQALLQGDLGYQAYWWGRATFMLAGVLAWLVQGLGDALSLWLGAEQVSPGLSFDLRVFGRMVVAALGALNVWALYRVARKLDGPPAQALLAAALMAVSPLLVAQSHYFTRDVPLALAATFCMWLAIDMARGGGPRVVLAAGAVFGLAFTTKASGILFAPAFVLAHMVGQLRSGRPRLQAWLGLPALFLAGFAGGVLIGNPTILAGYTDPFARAVELAGRYSQVGAAASAARNATVDFQAAWFASTVRDAIGWEMVALALAGLALALWRRRWATVVAGSFGAFFFLEALFIAHRMAERTTVALMPALLLLASYPVGELARRLPRRRLWPQIAAGALAVALCLPGLWTSVRTAYLFWQKDTREQAEAWVDKQLPPDAVVYHEAYAPTRLARRTKDLHQLKPAELGPLDYIIMSSAGHGRHFRPDDGEPANREGERLRRLQRSLQPVKLFDLKRRDQDASLVTGGQFPFFVSPHLSVYSGLPRREMVQPLAWQHPPANQEHAYHFVDANHPAYSLDASAGLAAGDGPPLERVLRTPAPLAAAEVEMALMGGGPPGEVVLEQGPWQRWSRALCPGLVWRVELEPDNWPTPVERVYPFRISMTGQGELLMRVHTEPLLLGQRALERGDWGRAAGHLRRALQAHPGSLLARGMLAAALRHSGRETDAAGLLRGREQDLRVLLGLLADDGDLDRWLKRLGDWSGHHPALLRNALSRRYPVPAYAGRAGSPVVYGPRHNVWTLAGSGAGDDGVTVQVREHFPAVPLVARVELAGSLRRPERQGQAVLEVSLQGTREVPHRLVLGPDELPGPGEAAAVDLSIRPQAPGQLWAVRLLAGLSGVEMKGLTLLVDPREALRASAKWVLWAWSRELDAQGHHRRSLEVLDRLASAAPDFPPGLRAHVRALARAGEGGRAAARLAEALPAIRTRPGLLEFGARVLAGLAAPEALALYRRALEELRPERKAEVAFQEGVRLLGYGLEPSRLQAGRTARLRLAWAFDRRPQCEYYVFVHLRGAEATLNYDHLLCQGRVRMTSLEAGEVVVDRVEMAIPPETPPGIYDLVVGMWDTRRSLKVADGRAAGDDSTVLAPVEVLPPGPE